MATIIRMPSKGNWWVEGLHSTTGVWMPLYGPFGEFYARRSMTLIVMQEPELPEHADYEDYRISEHSEEPSERHPSVTERRQNRSERQRRGRS